jgi:hypothetical protein
MLSFWYSRFLYFPVMVFIMSEKCLPSVSCDSYVTTPVNDLVGPGDVHQYALEIWQRFGQATDLEKRESPMIDAEKALLSQVLRYIDYCLPKDPRSTGARTPGIIRRSRMLAVNLLENCLDSELTIDDLRQEARIAAIRTVRNFDPSRTNGGDAPVFALIPYGIINRTNNVGADAFRGGLKHGTGLPGDQQVGKVTRNALSKRMEQGWSDELSELYEHPGFLRRVDLDFTSEESLPEELSYEDKYNLDSPTHEVDVTEEMAFEQLLNLAGDHGIAMPERTKKILAMCFINDLPYEEIGKLQDRHITRQRVGQIIGKVIESIRSDPELMALLSKDLEKFEDD